MFTNSLFFGAAISLLAYEVGLLLRKKFKKAIFNPLLIGILCVIGVLSIFHIEYDSYNVGGQYISYLLTPATVCLAVPLYEQLSLLKKNLVAVAAGIVSGVLASMVSVLLLCKLFQLSHEEYHCYRHGGIGRTGRNCDYHRCGHYYYRCAGQRHWGNRLQAVPDSRTHCQRSGAGYRGTCHRNLQSHGDGSS